MRIHITGAKGRLGAETVRELGGLAELQASDVDTMDVCDARAVLAALSGFRPDVVVHTAAIKGNQPSKDNPMLFHRVNTLGTLNLLEAARQLGVGRFVFISSISVHGQSEKEVSEQSVISPQHPYGASKAAAEAFVQAYCRAYGMRATIFRPNYIVGPIHPPMPYEDNLIYSFIAQFEKAGRVVLAGDGSFEREWTHPADIARAIRLAIEKERAGCEVYMLGSNRISMRGLAEGISKAMGRGLVATDPAIPGFTLTCSSAKAGAELGWIPARDIKAIIGEIWDEYSRRKGHTDNGNQQRDRRGPR